MTGVKVNGSDAAVRRYLVRWQALDLSTEQRYTRRHSVVKITSYFNV